METHLLLCNSDAIAMEPVGANIALDHKPFILVRLATDAVQGGIGLLLFLYLLLHFDRGMMGQLSIHRASIVRQ